ncbi:uncharacterized protein PAC_01678 [Phialocephala subalpina]|uniref:Xylanolytic transcriptional activator regulatory domain-containing protein n=1 Tax=Phialocephala subalpina TaxID=576137 RepID=A0A1L7WGB4_9HELO|nr:uncharacterized protein PAC_01678 [Phialocephala subalpina]
MPSDAHPRRKRIAQACIPCSNRKVKVRSGFRRPNDPKLRPGSAMEMSLTVDDAQRTMFSAFTGYQKGIKGKLLWYSKKFRRCSAYCRRLPSRSSLVEPHPVSPQSLRQVSLQASVPPIADHVPEFPQGLSINVPLHISSRLFQAYFRCIHPIWPVLYKPLYNSLDHNQLLEALALPLVYAIMSLAVLIQDVDGELLSKHEQAQNYFEFALKALRDTPGNQRSKSLLELQPSIVHCQVLTILALQQHSIGSFSQAGSLCASASYMAIDQSLHRNSESDNHVDTQIKSRLWWSIYTLEKMLSCEMSRPTLLRAEEADTPFPSVDESDEFEFYSESANAGTAMKNTRRQPLKLRTISAFHTSIRIAMIMESVSRQIYSIAARQRIREDRQAGEETRLRLWAELHAYELAMDASPLKLDITGSSMSVPVTVTNYIFIWATTILLHRPFIDSWQPSSTENRVLSSQNDPNEICFYAANRICSTIQMYTQFIEGLPCDLIFPIFVAANILLRRWQQSGGEDVEIRLQLDLCAKWLNGLGKSWKGAESRHKIIVESINLNSRDAQPSDPDPSQSAFNSEQPNPLSNSAVNLTLLSMENDFDLDYLQWVNSLDTQDFVNQ